MYYFKILYLFQQELRKLLAGHSLDIEQISSQIRLEYEDKLEKLRRDLREQHKYEMDQLRLELESQFSSEVRFEKHCTF